MPFDAAPEVRVELRILDEMREILATPEMWCKGRYSNGEAVCIMGALDVARGRSPGGPRPYPSPLEERNVIFTLLKSTPHHQKIWTFNDNPSTTHSDILSLIDRAREKIVADSL